MSESLIAIDRVPLSFIAAASPERAERVARRVRDAVAGSLPQALASACGRELDRDDAYVFIERLDVQCAVATHWADDAIAGLFAERLARALLVARDLGHALVFRDRAEFVSAFLAAVVDGGAFSRWWFEEFDGLAALPLSVSVRTVVINEGPVAWDALARLSFESRARVIAALAVADAERILAALAAEGGGAQPSMSAIIEALDATADMPLASLPARLVAALAHVAGHDAAAVSARSLAALSAVARIFEAASAHRLRGVTGDAPIAVIVAWCDAAGLGAAERTALMDLDPAPLIARVTPHAPAGADAPAAPDDLSFDYTPFGGALLLAVVLVRAGWWKAWRETLRNGGMGERADPLASWLALAVVAHALRPDDPAAVERDVPLRRAFGVPETLGVSRGRRLVRLLRARGRALLREFGRRVPGCEGSTGEYLRAQCLSLPAAVRADGAAARLGRPPLDVLLGFSGLKRASVLLPDGRALSLAEEIRM